MKISFSKRDFLYDNGLVNLFLTLPMWCSSDSEISLRYKNTKIELDHTHLTFEGDFEEMKELYFKLRRFYFSEIVRDTDNYRVYWDPERSEVRVWKKMDLKGYLSREKITHRIPTIRISSKEYYEEILPKLKSFKESNPENWKKCRTKNDRKIVKGDEEKIKEYAYVRVYKDPKSWGECIAAEIKDINKGDNCYICGSPYTKYHDHKSEKDIVLESKNLVFIFGSGKSSGTDSFRDFRSKKEIPVCFMCDLIYRYGLFYNFFIGNLVYMVSTPSLVITKRMKEGLALTDNKPNLNSKITTNFVEEAEMGIIGGSSSNMLFLLKRIYEKLTRKEWFELMHMPAFAISGEGAEDLTVYNKANYLVGLFDEIREIRDKRGRWFLDDLLSYAVYKDMTDNPKARNLPKEEMAKHILYGMPVEEILLSLSYYNLSLTKERRGVKPSYLNRDLCFLFLDKYLRVIGMENLKAMHKICRLIGEQIGYFAAGAPKEGKETLPENKTVLYQMREIGNIEGLTEFLKNFLYEVLKVDAGWLLADKAKTNGEEKTYRELLDELLSEVQTNKDVIVVRNYLGIYALQKYLAAKVRETSGGDKK